MKKGDRTIIAPRIPEIVLYSNYTIVISSILFPQIFLRLENNAWYPGCRYKMQLQSMQYDESAI
jgi:hypothetical protein